MTRCFLYRFAVLCVVLGGYPFSAQAEFQLSVYAGAQSASDSTVKGTDPSGIGNFDFDTSWEGESGKMPPYWGLRGTWWRTDKFGLGVEFTHAKVSADSQTMQANGFQILEFTDGLNILTVNVARRWRSDGRRWMPYLSGGLGVAVPHVEVETIGGKTIEYQLTGPAARWTAGVAYFVNQKWSLFAEYGGTYSWNKADLDNGGSLETNILTNAVNLGVGYSFGR